MWDGVQCMIVWIYIERNWQNYTVYSNTIIQKEKTEESTIYIERNHAKSKAMTPKGKLFSTVWWILSSETDLNSHLALG